MASLSDNTDHIANDLAKGGDEAVAGGMLLPLQLPLMFLSLSAVSFVTRDLIDHLQARDHNSGQGCENLYF